MNSVVGARSAAIRHWALARLAGFGKSLLRLRANRAYLSNYLRDFGVRVVQASAPDWSSFCAATTRNHFRTASKYRALYLRYRGALQDELPSSLSATRKRSQRWRLVLRSRTSRKT
jgi:hypothetical protein